MVGLIAGVARLILEFIKPAPDCGKEDERLWIVSKFHYMYYALIIFWLVIAVMVVISLLTKPLPDEMVRTEI